MPKPNRVTLTAPERIRLQVSDDAADRREPFPPLPDAEITWCPAPVLSCEVAYIRADLVRRKRYKRKTP